MTLVGMKALAILCLLAGVAIAQPTPGPPGLTAVNHDGSMTGDGKKLTPLGSRLAVGGGLDDAGGTTGIGLLTSCGSTQVLVWGGTSWGCGAPYIAATNTTIFNASQIATWGDSLTMGFTLTDTTSYPTQLASLSGYTVSNGGVSGETCSQISTRMMAATATHAYPTIIWAGRNGFDGNVASTEACIAGMVAALGTTNYIVLSVPNGDTALEYSGGAIYTELIGMNNDLAAAYGSHYLDVRAYLVSLYNPGIPQDVIDHGHDLPPSSLRVDWLHPNDAGYIAIANYIYAHIALLQGAPVRVVVESDIPGLLNGVFHSGVIANHVIPEGNGTGLVASSITDDLAGTIALGATTSITPVGIIAPNIAIKTDVGNMLSMNTITGNVLKYNFTSSGASFAVAATVLAGAPQLLLQNPAGSGGVSLFLYANNGAKTGELDEGSDGSMVLRNNSASAATYFDIAAGGLHIRNSSFADSVLINDSKVVGIYNVARLTSTGLYQWSSDATPVDAADTGIGRNAAGVVEINNGTAGTYRDLITRAMYLNGTTKHSAGTGVPAISCAVGDEFDRTDGAAGTTLYSCTTTNTWTAVGSGGGSITGSGTANTTTKFTGTSAIGNGWALDDGTSWGVSGKFLITEASGNTAVAGTLTADGGSRVLDSTGTGLVQASNSVSLNINGGSTQTCASDKAITALTGVGLTTCTFFYDSAGTGLATGATNNIIKLADTAVTPGSYTNASITVDQQGRITAASSGGGGGGITNSAGNNVIMKSNGTNAVASGLTDNASTISTSEAVTISGLTTTTGGLSNGGVLIEGATAVVTGASGTVTDYAPTGIATAAILDITTSAAMTIAGFSASQVTGRRLVVRNNASSTDSINFIPGWSGTTAGNRLQIAGGGNWSMRTGTSMTFVYDGTFWTQEGAATVTFPTLLADGTLTIGGTSALFGSTKVGTGGDSASTAGALLYATNAGTTSIVARDSTNHVEVFMGVGSSGAFIGAGTAHSLTLETNSGVQAVVIDTSQRTKFLAHVGLAGSVPSLSSCGSGSAIDSDSNDGDGDITVGSSTSSCTVTFAVGYTNKTICTATPNAVGITNVAVTAVSSSAFTVSGQGSFGGGTAHIYYHCFGMKGF